MNTGQDQILGRNGQEDISTCDLRSHCGLQHGVLQNLSPGLEEVVMVTWVQTTAPGVTSEGHSFGPVGGAVKAPAASLVHEGQRGMARRAGFGLRGKQSVERLTHSKSTRDPHPRQGHWQLCQESLVDQYLSYTTVGKLY